jgi:2-succinyl-6-hydroxy-2,4-cyclohexadiene-1-carboxylate synthase
MPIVDINDVKYHALAAGNQQGVPLVALHGFSGSSSNWCLLHERSGFEGYRLLMPDLLGHGASGTPDDPARYSMGRAAADLVCLVEQLATPPVHLLGYSMGGRLALYVAAHYPKFVRSLLLESSSPGLADLLARRQRRDADRDLASWIEANGIPAFVRRWEALPLWASQASLPRQRRHHQRQQRLTNTATGLANSLRGLGTGVQPDLWPALPGLHLPVLLITGQLDQKFTAIGRQMCDALPNCAHNIVAGCGHNTHLERPDLFTNILLAWLSTDHGK